MPLLFLLCLSGIIQCKLLLLKVQCLDINGGGLDPPFNHQITNKKWLKSPYHQQKMAQITITKCPLRSPITKQKASNHHTFFCAQKEVSVKKWQFSAPFLLLLQIWNNHQITNKNSSITITTTSQNHQITTFLRY